MNKKAIAILGAIFLLIVGTLGFLIYTKYSSGDKVVDEVPVDNGAAGQQTPSDNTVTTDPSLNGSISGSPLVKLSDDQVISPALFYNGGGITYFNNQGELYQININASSTPLQLSGKRKLDIQNKSGISGILWPDRGDNFIAEFNTAGKRTWSFYDSQTGTYVDLPSQIYSLGWMPGGQKIVYTWLANGKMSLYTADASTKNYQKIADLFETDDQVIVSPDGASIVFYRNESTDLNNKITQTTPDGKFWKDLVKDGYNIGALWSPDSKHLLFQKREPSSQKFQLWYFGFLSGEIKNLGLFTSTEKAVWAGDSQTVYAAVPTTPSAGQDVLTADSFYRIDTSSLEKKQYSTGTVVADGQDLFLDLTGTKLFFKNAQDGGLYYLDLSQ